MRRFFVASISAQLVLASAAPLHAAVLTPKVRLLTEKSRAVLNTAARSATARPVLRSSYPWKRGIMTTIFWIGERAAANNPVPNDKSSWDARWARNYGGYDDPDPRARRDYRPARFTPRLNPFYVALPYNDVSNGRTKPEAATVIPWFNNTFVRHGESVCKGRWLAIHYRGRVAFAQWEDVGPFRTNHWQYVFGDERPLPNRNNAAGLDISPAVRDYLGLKSNDRVDWRFVEASEVPYGPWSRHTASSATLASAASTQSGELQRD
ncbi:MAG: hypothetical protein FGM15_11465 [Chthoniobacterales bacterium]|nr:hypothetical protein [Chthoniobacterales bacterium]